MHFHIFILAIYFYWSCLMHPLNYSSLVPCPSNNSSWIIKYVRLFRGLVSQQNANSFQMFTHSTTRVSHNKFKGSIAWNCFEVEVSMWALCRHCNSQVTARYQRYPLSQTTKKLIPIIGKYYWWISILIWKSAPNLV